MTRSIAKCGFAALCMLVTSCSNLSSQREETSETAVPESGSEAAAPESAQEEEGVQDQAPDRTPPAARYEGRHENLTCFSGTKDRQARIGVKLVNGEVTYFAYYSKWRPRTCSLEAGRGDAFSRWVDHQGYSTVTLADHKGRLRIEHNGGAYRFAFFDVDRGRYCGMPGKINGSLTVTRGKSSCEVEGVMDGHAL